MLKKTLSSSQWLNLFLGSLIVAGGIASYTLGNFDGVSFDELGENYIPKQDVKFSDLPLELQKRYIDKEATLAQSKEANNLELDRYVDDFGNIIPEEALTIQDLKRMIARLQKTLLFLHHDNFLITNDKDELLQKLEEQQTKHENEKKSWLDQNTLRLNEAEEQHFKNITELTLKLNELQKENVLLAQKANSESNTLKSEIQIQKAKQAEEEAKTQKAIQLAREEEQAKFIPYEKNIAELKKQIVDLNETLRTQSEKEKTLLESKENEMNRKAQLIEQYTQKLKEAEEKQQQEIQKHAQTKEQFKREQEQILAQHQEELRVKDEEMLKKIALEQEKTKQVSAELSSAKKHVDALILEGQKDFEKFKSYLEDEKKRYETLSLGTQEQEKVAQKKIQQLEISLKEAATALNQKEAEAKALNEEISKLQILTKNIDQEVQKRVDEINKTHNKNYRIFNEKIANFDRYKQELLEQLDQQLSEYKATAKENYDRMEHQTKELTQANHALSLQTTTQEQELKTLRAQLAMLGEQNEKNQRTDMTKLKEAHEALITLKENLKQKESLIESLHVKMQERENNATKSYAHELETVKAKLAISEKNRMDYEAKVLALQEEFKQKENTFNTLHVKLKEELKQKEMAYLDALKNKENDGSKSTRVTEAKPSSVEKLRYVDQISCADMGTGVNALSVTCKNNVQAFLAKYDRSYFFEITPIVDNGGFASLQMIKAKKVGIEESEIDRISTLANIGLGKARAKAGGELVENYLGEGAKISYALSNIEQAKARGFQIKVYR